MYALEPQSVEDVIEVVKVNEGRSVNHTIAQRLQTLARAEAGTESRRAAALSGLRDTQSVKRVQKARDRGYGVTILTI